MTIFATGSEVEIAVAARKLLADKGKRARVVSVPCLDLFLSQPADVRAKVIGDAPVRIAVEAAVRQGWDEVIGATGVFVGMTGFGASAPPGSLPSFRNYARARRQCSSGFRQRRLKNQAKSARFWSYRQSTPGGTGRHTTKTLTGAATLPGLQAIEGEG